MGRQRFSAAPRYSDRAATMMPLQLGQDCVRPSACLAGRGPRPRPITPRPWTARASRAPSPTLILRQPRFRRPLRTGAMRGRYLGGASGNGLCVRLRASRTPRKKKPRMGTPSASNPACACAFPGATTRNRCRCL